MRSTADKIGGNNGNSAYNASGFNQYYGYGRVNANAALAATPSISITDMPTQVDLASATDTGTSGTDNVTNLDNSTTTKKLQFVVTGTTAGATVKIYAGATLIGSAIASGEQPPY